MAQQFIPTPGGNIYPDPDTDYDQSEAFRKVALNRDAQDSGLAAGAAADTAAAKVSAAADATAKADAVKVAAFADATTKANAAKADAIAQANAYTDQVVDTSHLALDTDGTPYFSPGSMTYRIFMDTDGNPYFRES